MKKLYRRLYGSEEGFTLMELMIVIIIIAILTAIAVPSYMVLRDRARTSAAQSEMRAIATALEMYNADNDEYPVGDAAAMITALETPSATGEDPYMDPVPANDPWGKPYVYTSDGTTYTLTCNGADGAAGGDDDIVIENGQLQ